MAYSQYISIIQPALGVGVERTILQVRNAMRIGEDVVAKEEVECKAAAISGAPLPAGTHVADGQMEHDRPAR